MNKNHPLFIGIGGHRCASTWLFENIKIINDLNCENKETHFFSRHYDYGLNWYYNSVLKKNNVSPFCEFSTSYFYSYEAPIRIKKFFPNSKILLILRNPIHRSYSHYRHEIYKNRSDSINLTDSFHQNPSLIEFSFYYNYLKRWLEFYDFDNMKVILFDDIEKNPLKEINSIQNFLGLKNHDSSLPFPDKINYSQLPNDKINEKYYRFIKNIYNKNKFIMKFLPSPIKDLFKLNVEKKFFSSSNKNDGIHLFTISEYLKSKGIKKDIDSLSNLLNKNLFDLWFNE